MTDHVIHHDTSDHGSSVAAIAVILLVLLAFGALLITIYRNPGTANPDNSIELRGNIELPGGNQPAPNPGY